MHLSEIDTKSAVNLMPAIGHTHLESLRSNLGGSADFGPATFCDTHYIETQFGNFLLATLKRKFLSPHHFTIYTRIWYWGRID